MGYSYIELDAEFLWLIKFNNLSYKNYNPIALRKAKIVYNFGLSDCSRVKTGPPFTLKVKS